MTAFWGNKRAGRGHDFPRRSLHLRIALGKLLERPSQHNDEMEVQSEPKINKTMIQKPTPGGVPHRLGGALKGSWALLSGFRAWNSNYDDFCLIFLRVLGSSWGRLGAQDGRLGGQTQNDLPRRPMMLLRCLQDSPRSDFHPPKKRALRARMAFSIRF